ncbi:MAG: hypothetical protein NTZ56_01585 [Acidobacteria bacterium]|nr:hypothetical protein [Acidobacteriota bacterium]
MTELEFWLAQATRKLSREAGQQVRQEIGEHFASAREAALERGVAAGQADQAALAALGDAREANRRYREVLLTAAEARMLNDGNREARAYCTVAWVKALLLILPAAALAGAVVCFRAGREDVGRGLLAAAIGMSLFFLAPYLPIYTPSRGRAFRAVKWAILIGALGLTFGSHLMSQTWLFASCLWPIIWVEWTRTAIRRKLPVARWPKQLYL